jgi:ubiquinone/menaquinone biosynthesis C-methylase UbiE
MPSFAARTVADEMMDDFSIVDARLTRALDNLRYVNRYLGGYAATMKHFVPLLRSLAERPVQVLDLATGVADFPDYLVNWADRRSVHVDVIAVDANPATVAYACDSLNRDLPQALRARIDVVEGDALATGYDDDAFDVSVTTLFMHHLSHKQAVHLVREMDRVSRYGFVVNDLQRHRLAYYGISFLGNLLPVSPMFRHDGPVSVLRGFTRDELHTIAREAELEDYEIRWHWAFRWTLSTVRVPGDSA